MNLSDTDQAPYSAPAVSGLKTQEDFFVQLHGFAGAITQISFEGGDADGGQIQDLAEKFGILREEPFDPDNKEHQNVCEAGEFERGMPVYFLRALPHLSLSALPCSIEAKKLPCDVQLPGAIFKRGVSISTLIAALERREHWPDEDTHLPAKPVDVAAEREKLYREAYEDAVTDALNICRKFDDISLAEIESGIKALQPDPKIIRALSPAEPVDQRQDIATAPKDGTEILVWREDCGWLIASYTSLDAFPMSQSELNELDEETLFKKDWFTQFGQCRLEGSEVPTHWMPLPAAPTSKGGE